MTNFRLNNLPAAGLIIALVVSCCCMARSAISGALPAEVPINAEAGRGGLLIVPLRLESGEELPFILDTGSGTCFDKSFAPGLGKAVGTETVQSWGVKTKVNVYATPKLYLGGAALFTQPQVVTYDLARFSRALGVPIKGMLGIDCLRHYCIQLDFAAGKMRFLDDERSGREGWGKAFPIVPLNSNDDRPAVSQNLYGSQGPHSLIDSGYDCDGWLMPKFFQQWTNEAVVLAKGQVRSPYGLFGGEKYSFMSLRVEDVESDGIGLRFLARHLVTLDFPKNTMYLLRQSMGPLTDPRLKTTHVEALAAVIQDVQQEDAVALSSDVAALQQSNATELEKAVARNLAATLQDQPRAVPAEVTFKKVYLPLGDARPELAEVGWLKPAANRIPLNAEIQSPLLDSGKIYATGLFAHSPSRYVYKLGGKWQRLRGEAGLHTAFQGKAFGVIFLIKADGTEVFRSEKIRGTEHARYDIDVTGVKTLELSVEKAVERNGGNWALWLEPTLLRQHSPLASPKSQG